MTTKKEVIEYFEKIGLPPFFKKLYSGELKQSDASIFAGCPEEYFLMSVDEQKEYSNGVLIPIIDNGNFDSVIYHNPKSGSFVQLSVDGPVTILNEFQNWKQILFDILCRAHESIDTEEELLQLCKDMNIEKYSAEWLAFLSSTEELGYDEYKLEKTAFMRGIQ